MNRETRRAIVYMANVTVILVAILSIAYSLLPVPGTIVMLLVSFSIQTISFYRLITTKSEFSHFGNELVGKLEQSAGNLLREGRVARADLVKSIEHGLDQVRPNFTGQNILEYLETRGRIKQSVSGEGEEMEKFVAWVSARDKLVSYLRSLWSR